MLIASVFSPTQEELEFLLSHVKPTDRVWEWGAGVTTELLSRACKSVTTVEHNPIFAARTCLSMRGNVSVLSIPPNLPFSDESGADGDYDTFRSYVKSYSGEGIDVVLIDGRAREACSRQVAWNAEYGPNPGMLVFLHDCDRPEYASIWSGDEPDFNKVAQCGRMMLLEPIER